MFAWLKKLFGKKDAGKTEPDPLKTRAEQNGRFDGAKEQSWNNAGDARRNHPGSGAGHF